MRRRLVVTGGACLLVAPGVRRAIATPVTVEVRLRSDPDGASVGFDPIGLWVAPGTTVRWVVEANVHTTTAYHPANGGHPLRIPEQARQWDSDYLVEPGQSFEVVLTVPGTYDYFCLPHEAAGMVGRIIVGRPGGPGTREPGDELPPAARAALPTARRIMAERTVPLAGGHGHTMGSDDPRDLEPPSELPHRPCAAMG